MRVRFRSHGSLTGRTGASADVAARGSAQASATGGDAARPTGLDVVPPELLVLIGALSVQGGAGLATQLLREYGPLPIVAMRIGFGALLLVLVRPVDVRSATRRANSSSPPPP